MYVLEISGQGPGSRRLSVWGLFFLETIACILYPLRAHLTLGTLCLWDWLCLGLVSLFYIGLNGDGYRNDLEARVAGAYSSDWRDMRCSA